MMHTHCLRPLLPLALMLCMALTALSQRRITPVVPAQPGAPTVSKVEEPIDRTHLVTTVDADGNTITVDTITGKEFVDTTQLLQGPPPMEFPLIYQGSLGVSIWDPLMRAFGQKYGLGEAWVEINLHNRYMPQFTLGFSDCNDTPANKNYTFKSSIAPYFKLGAMYNFLYNSNPDYKVLGGLRYGFSAYKWSVEDVTVNEGYWNDPSHYALDGISNVAGWIEVAFGIRVKLWRNISAGWNIVYHSVLHESRSPHGKPMYLPGYGKRSNAVTGNFSFIYTIPINKRNIPEVE
ncbi:MAG: DUF6048 family protein [Muribaculaceae bacterium]|nr:DUF6048 family protein [Muribaculaceae bacterium]